MTIFSIFSRSATIENLRLFKIKVNGTQSRELIQKVVSEPFNTLQNKTCQAQFEFLKKNYRNILLTNSDKVLLSLILSKPNYESAVHEIPHLFYHVLRTNQRLIPVPSVECFHPPDCRSADLILADTHQLLETKTTKLLSLSCIDNLHKQYVDNKFNEDLFLSVLFKNKSYADVIEKNYLPILESLRFKSEKCFFLTSSDIIKFKEDSVFDKVLGLYGISRTSFSYEQLDLLEKQLLFVQKNTNFRLPGVVRFLNRVQEERASLSCPFYRRNPLRKNPHLALHDIISDRALEDNRNIQEDKDVYLGDSEDGYPGSVDSSVIILT